MHLPHPRRYTEAFQAQLARLERLCPGITTPSGRARPSREFLELEHAGATVGEIAERHERLRHLERLLVDWRLDGEKAFVMRADDVEDVPARAETIDYAPVSVTYVELPVAASFRLLSRPKSRIEGFYVREVVSDVEFSAEITFVCDEPGWKTMDACLYGDAMDVGSRIAICVIPLGEDIDRGEISRFLEGTPRLATETALSNAISAAGVFLASRSPTNRPSAASFARTP